MGSGELAASIVVLFGLVFLVWSMQAMFFPSQYAHEFCEEQGRVLEATLGFDSALVYSVTDAGMFNLRQCAAFGYNGTSRFDCTYFSAGKNNNWVCEQPQKVVING